MSVQAKHVLTGGALADILRVRDEPCRHFTEAEVHDLLVADPAGYFAFVREAMKAIASGRAQATVPPKQVFTDPVTGGDFRVMPCELRDGGGVMKTVKVVGTNTLQRKVLDQITVGKLLVLDPGENFVAAIMDACLLSSARTGVCAALAIDTLARARRKLVVMGCGRVGFYAALCAIAAGGIEHVTFCDPIDDRARGAARWFAAEFPAIRCDVQPVGAIASADVVLLATTSAAPIASPPSWGANLVISLGADADSQAELDPAWGRHAEIYCDTLDSLRFGDLRAWSEAGQIDASAVSGLLDVLRNPPTRSDRPRVFVSTGSALFDNLTARYLLERAGV